MVGDATSGVAVIVLIAYLAGAVLFVAVVVDGVRWQRQQQQREARRERVLLAREAEREMTARDDLARRRGEQQRGAHPTVRRKPER